MGSANDLCLFEFLLISFKIRLLNISELSFVKGAML